MKQPPRFFPFSFAVLLFLFLAACTIAPAQTAPVIAPTPSPSRPTRPLEDHDGGDLLRTQESQATTTPRPDLSTMRVETVTSTSPDGTWTAEALLAFFLGDMDYARLDLYWQSNGSYREWRPYEEWSESGLGDSFLSNFYWSPDGRYVYFMHRGITHPCGYPFATNLRRVDLRDGSLQEIPLAGLELGDISISPDVSRMAYRHAEGILVHEFEGGSSGILSYPWPPGYGFTVGGYVWSADGKELAFTLTEPLCDALEQPRSSTRVINLDTGSARTPTQKDAWVYLPDRVSSDPIPTATLALHDYLESLYWGGRGGKGEYTYDRAAAIYGGSYDTLIEMNPNIDPGDQAALLRNACEVNGFQCLRLRDVTHSVAIRGEAGVQMVYFTVFLANPDNGIFALGACCGDERGVPQVQFSFNLKQFEDGNYKVLELPPYVP